MLGVIRLQTRLSLSFVVDFPTSVASVRPTSLPVKITVHSNMAAKQLSVVKEL